jgi:SAM-dependent methyltransferase
MGPPAFITRCLVEQALGGVLKERFNTLRRLHEAKATGTARKALADPNAYDLNTLNEPQRKALIRFWEAWQEVLTRLRILDLACGSGAFLIEAFDQLHALYEISNARLEELRGQRTLFDLDRQILQHSLYGVDLNAEAMLQNSGTDPFKGPAAENAQTANNPRPPALAPVILSGSASAFILLVPWRWGGGITVQNRGLRGRW